MHVLLAIKAQKFNKNYQRNLRNKTGQLIWHDLPREDFLDLNWLTGLWFSVWTTLKTRVCCVYFFFLNNTCKACFTLITCGHAKNDWKNYWVQSKRCVCGDLSRFLRNQFLNIVFLTRACVRTQLKLIKSDLAPLFYIVVKSKEHINFIITGGEKSSTPSNSLRSVLTVWWWQFLPVESCVNSVTYKSI